jgi:amino acid transporter
MAFSIAANILQVRGLDNIVNATLLVFVVSAANSDLYIASRTLYSLALLGHAPRIFRKVTKRGVPYLGTAHELVVQHAGIYERH